jgi:Domain of unknown function (DUF4397)
MKKVNFLKSSALLLALSLFVFASTGCGKDDPVVVVADSAKAIIVHASPDAPGVNISLDGTVVTALGTLEFGKSTAYTALPATKEIKVGLRVPAAAADAYTAGVTLKKDVNYTILAIERLAKIGFLSFDDTQLLVAPAAGKAKVRFIHASPDAPEVDITAKGSTAKIFDKVAFKSAAIIETAAGTLDLDVKVAGTQTVALSLPGVKLEAGKIYTVFANGLLKPIAGTTDKALGAGIIVNN